MEILKRACSNDFENVYSNEEMASTEDTECC